MSVLADWLSLRRASVPTTAVEVAANHVCAATLDMGSRPAIRAHALQGLPAGAVVPSLTSPNVVDRRTVLDTLRHALEAVGRPRRVALIVPDAVARVSLIRFEKTPTSATDLDQLVRWQVRKAAPFPIEDAQVSYVPTVRFGDGQEFLVSVARRSVIQEYEDLCHELGAHAGLVDLSTFNTVNAVLAAGSSGPGDWLLVNVAVDSASIVILRGADPIFFRNRAADAEGVLADLVHQTAMYYQDRLEGTGFSRVWLCGASAAAEGRPVNDVERMRRSLEERLSMTVETVDPRKAVALSDRIGPAQPLLDALTPVVGAVLRTWSAAA